MGTQGFIVLFSLHCLSLKFSIVESFFFFLSMVPKLPGDPHLVWDPHPTVSWTGTQTWARLEVDPSGAISASNLLCDVSQVTHHLWPSVPQGRRSLNLVGSKHLPSLTLDTSTLHAQRAHWRAVGFPYHSSREPLQKGFCSHISWKDAASQHPCPGKLQATLAH